MAKKLQQRRDTNQLAKFIVEKATGQVKEVDDAAKHPVIKKVVGKK